MQKSDIALELSLIERKVGYAYGKTEKEGFPGR